MIKSLEQMTVAQIFPINDNKVYTIPKYQREYTWGYNEWYALFNDVMENEEGYFLGSFICVNTSSLGTNKLEIIDGQQRFTTLVLLFTALYAKLKHYESQMDEEEKHDLVNLRYELANRDKKEFNQRLILQKQNSNDEDFSFILSSNGIISEKVSEPYWCGNRRIARAFRYFSKLIQEKIDEDETTKPVDDLFSIKDKFEKAVLVGIEVDSSKSAYMLFESLNNRGVPLSAIDLMKNTLIRYAGDEADNNYNLWKNILVNIGPDDYAVQERFFRQYYNAFRDELNEPFRTSGDKKEFPLAFIATRTTLLDIYESLIKRDHNKILKDLHEKSEYYSILVNNSDKEFVYTPALRNLARIGGAPSYILLLYLLSKQRELNLSDDQINKIVNILITFFVRRNVTDVPPTRKLILLFIDVVGVIHDCSGEAIVSLIKEQLQAVSAPDSQFEEKLRGPIYEELTDATRFILCSIEEKNSTKEIHTDLWIRNNKQYVWTIEHIFPEGENIPDCWVTMIAGEGNRELANEYRQKYVHTLGNLTITGYNSNLSNMSFEDKRDRKKDGKDIGYRNGLYLNQDVVSEDRWTVDRITARTDKLVKTLLEMYSW